MICWKGRAKEMTCFCPGTWSAEPRPARVRQFGTQAYTQDANQGQTPTVLETGSGTRAPQLKRGAFTSGWRFLYLFPCLGGGGGHEVFIFLLFVATYYSTRFSFLVGVDIRCRPVIWVVKPALVPHAGWERFPLLQW